MGLQGVERNDTGLLSFQVTAAMHLLAYMRYNSCPRSPAEGEMVNTFSQRFQFVLHVPIAHIPSCNNCQKRSGLVKKLSHIMMCPFPSRPLVSKRTMRPPTFPSWLETIAPQYMSIFCTYLEALLAKHHIFKPYWVGFPFRYCWIGAYLPVYLTIILSTHKFCLGF